MTNKLYLIYMEQIGSFSFDPNTFELVDIIERLPNETEEQQDERAAYIADRWEANRKTSNGLNAAALTKYGGRV